MSVTRDRIKIMGVDLGTTAAWCTITTTGTAAPIADSKLHRTGVIDTWKPARARDEAARFGQFSDRIRTLVGKYHPDVIAFERTDFASALRAAQVAGGYRAVLASIAYECAVPLVGISLSTIRGRLFGMGGVSKEVIHATAREKYPGFARWDNLSGDEYDAVLAGLAYTQGGVPVPPKPRKKKRPALAKEPGALF